MKAFLRGLLVLILAANTCSGQSSTGAIYPCEVLPLQFSSMCYQDCWLDTLDLGGDTNQIKLSSSCDLWQIGNNLKPEFGNPGEDFGIETDLDSAYSSSSSCSFWINPSNNPFQWASTVLLFEHRYSTDSLKDGGVIEFSCNGVDWNNVVYESANFPAAKNYLHFPGVEDSGGYYNPGTIPTLDDINYSFTGASDTWIWSGIEFIWAFPVKSIQNNQSGCEFSNMDSLQFRFSFQSDSTFDNQPGWMIRNIVVGSIDLGSGIDEKPLNRFFAYPNPTQDYIFLKQIQEGTSYELLNNTGQLIRSGSYSTVGINTTDLTNGIYWLKWYQGHTLRKTNFLKDDK